jgi:hypothetical protein
MLPVPLLIHPNLRLHHMHMALLALSKHNLRLNRLEQLFDLLCHPPPIRPHPPLPPPKLKYLR